PNLLIPLSTDGSRGDQILNAEAFAKNGYSKVLLEKDMDNDTLISAIDEVYDNSSTYKSAMENAPENGAVKAIYDVITEVLNER
ncbi:MAG: UDP-N-acetylglucosamine--N-acetylmuramyl-(pentapeptide) pyrophosphoryl-undecaprenol N-acetylglucosamine transferase, partial [Lachnospiraceae bacterium]|nr:UDP-N-acetylglucosamine--N-acetylmuramyl-(pentapeptide) pyrophosphoryl-undecaprenol N-acetylglucosamine transferase [Lachnospiraceae bacterium]